MTLYISIIPIKRTSIIKCCSSLLHINVEMKKNGDLVTHADLLEYIKKNDEAGYRDALERHFAVYKIFMSEREKLKESHDMDSV